MLADAARILKVIEHTWPPIKTFTDGPWTIREGGGGGSRVSAATREAAYCLADIDAAADAMRSLGQSPLFMIREGDEALDQDLAACGYAIKDPVYLYAISLTDLASERPPPVTSFAVWPPLAAQKELWAAGGIGAGRLAVMARTPHPKTTLLGRCDDGISGTAFVGTDAECAMIHALEVSTRFRGRGHAKHLMRAAAFWALAHGCEQMTLVTTRANTAANALYSSLGMTVVGQYHYRTLPED